MIDGDEDSGGPLVGAFRQELERTGWAEGRNLQSTTRWGYGDPDRIRKFAAELVKLNPDLLFVSGGTGLAALQQETRSIPVTFVFAGDPVAAGMVTSISRPGGNATGFTAYEGGGFATKWLELLKEIAPAITRVLVLNSGNPSSSVTLPAIEAAARSFGVEMAAAIVTNPTEIERAIATSAGGPKTGMMVLPGSRMIAHRDLFVALAARYRLPAIYPGRIYLKTSGLMSYGVDLLDLYRQAAPYVDRLFRGQTSTL